MTDAAMAKAPGKILHFPIVAGGVAIMYNLPGNPKLKLDGDTLANIYLGNIKKWNDPKITALNPGVDLPDLAIVPVYRTEGSGTTFIFTDYLSAVNPVWADTVGKSTSVKWPAGIGLGAKGSEGVAGQVKQISGAIGYGELAYADQSKIPYADMKNSSGNFISPAPASVSAALATATIPADFRFSMVNPHGADAYPIAGASWVLIYQRQKSADHGKKLVAFLKWAVTEGQKISSTLDYAPLPDNVQQSELKLLDTIKY
jgi:phosphate transport system substrate-binding protein